MTPSKQRIKHLIDRIQHRTRWTNAEIWRWLEKPHSGLNYQSPQQLILIGDFQKVDDFFEKACAEKTLNY